MIHAFSSNFNKKNKLIYLENFHWLISLIRQLRPDLRCVFPNKDNNSLKFLIWLLSYRSNEYNVLLNDTIFQNFLEEDISQTQLTPLQSLIYLTRKDIQIQYPNPEKKSNIVTWFYKYGVREYNLWPFLTRKQKHKVINIYY